MADTKVGAEVVNALMEVIENGADYLKVVEADCKRLRSQLSLAHEKIGALKAELAQRANDHDTTTGNLAWNVDLRKQMAVLLEEALDGDDNTCPPADWARRAESLLGKADDQP